MPVCDPRVINMYIKLQIVIQSIQHTNRIKAEHPHHIVSEKHRIFLHHLIILLLIFLNVIIPQQTQIALKPHIILLLLLYVKSV